MRRRSTDGADNLGTRVALFTVIGLAALVAAVWVGLYVYAGDKAPRNASVEGVSIAGLEPQEAEDRLRTELAEKAEQPITLSYGDGRSTSVVPADAGLSVDHRASVRQAGGGSGFGPRRMWAVLTGGGDHDAELEVDQPKMQATLDDLDDGIRTPPVQGTVAFKDGRAVAVRSRPGLVVDRSAAQEILERRFLHGGSQKVPTRSEEPEITDADVRRAMEEFGRPAMSGPVTIDFAGEKVEAPPKLFGRGLSMEAEDGELVPRVDGEKVLDALAPVMRTVGREPVDAGFEVVRGKPRVVPAKVGIELDPEQLEKELADVVTAQGDDRRLEVDGRKAQPDFTTADARKLGITEEVSSFPTHFPYAEYRNVNLSRAAELVDGTVLEPGETFSLNETVGERTKENGFTEGYVVSDGIFKKDLGGGVSQIATTTFNAMFFAGLKDIEHKPHSVYIDRYPAGREATVAWPSLDLRFQNDTPHGVLIKARVRKAAPGGQGTATVTMYSTKRWDIKAVSGPRTDIRQPQVRYLQDDDCEEFSGTRGFSINVFRHFRDLDSGKVLRKERFHTDYIAGDTVRCGPPPKPGN